MPRTPANRNDTKATPTDSHGQRYTPTEIRALARVLKQYELTSLEVRDGDHRVRLERQVAPQVTHTVAAPAPPPCEPAAPADVAPSDGSTLITSPFVGTFYRAPAPEADPFVDVGTTVKKGQVLCIVEAMKLMNDIEAEEPCQIVEIICDNADPVEFGQPLFRVKPLG